MANFLESQGLMSLQDALREAERGAVKTSECVLDGALEIARTEAHHPSVVAVWRDTIELGQTADILFPSRKVAALVIEDSVEPQAVGHALVQAAYGGHIHCVRRLRELQSEHLSGSMLVGRFNAFAFLKAAEAGKVEVIRELLRPLMSACTAIMGYVVATRWKDSSSNSYPFVEQPATMPGKDWVNKLASTKAMLPPARPIFQSGGWDLVGMPGVQEEGHHEAIRASYRTYLLWRTALVAAWHGHVEVLKVLLKQRAVDNSMLADSFQDTAASQKGFDHDAKKIIADRARMDTLMYQLVEEFSTKNYHDSILYALWGHIQRGGRDSPRPEAGRPRVVTQAQNGLWEMQLEVPMLMMPVEHVPEEEPFRRYKHLTQLFTQRAKVNIQLISTVEAMPSYVQVTVGIKHVRFKVENSRWDMQSMGHFPCLVSLAVTPVTSEGTGVTMTNSSSNVIYKIGVMERVQAGTGIGDGGSKGLSAHVGISVAKGVSSTMKSKPWRFEQLPLKDERGGSFVWTLQAMKGVSFDRSNPMRMAETNSKWRFGKRIPDNPLSELPFTSEGGVIFTSNEFDDTMIWRFPKHMEETKLRWIIEGQIHSTFTTTKYFETRFASFCGDIVEKLKPLEVKDKSGKDKGDKEEKGEKGEKGEKKDKGEKGEKGEKKDKSEKGEKGEKDKGEKGEKKEKGEKGEKGEKAEKGEKGEKEEKGEKGEKGDKAEKGEKGEKEEKGEKGEKGDKVKKGEKGEKVEKSEKGEKGANAEKGEKGEKEEKGKKGEKEEKGEKAKKSERGDKEQTPEGDDSLMDPEYLEWLEFKKYKIKMQAKLKAESDGGGAEKNEKKEKVKSIVIDTTESSQVGHKVVTKTPRRASKGRMLASSPLGDDPPATGASIVSLNETFEGEDLYKVPEIWKRRVDQDTEDDSRIKPKESLPQGGQLNTSSRRITGLSVRTRMRDIGRRPPAGE